MLAWLWTDAVLPSNVQSLTLLLTTRLTDRFIARLAQQRALGSSLHAYWRVLVRAVGARSQ